MRFWKHTVLAAALTGLALPAFAVDLLETWQAARAYDSAYAAAFAAAQAGQEKAPQARAPLLPQLALSGDYTRGFPEKPLLQPRFRTGNAGAQLTQTLFDWSKFAVLEKGKQAALIATDQLAAAEQDLILRVAQAYFDVLLAEDSLAFTQAAKQAFAQQLALAKKSFEVGSLTITDTYEAQASNDAAVASELAADSDLVIKRNRLQLLAGVNPTTLATLKAKLPLATPSPAEPESWVSRAEAGSYALAIRQKQLLIAQKEVEVSRSGHLPSVNLVAGYNDRMTTQMGLNDTRGSSVGVQVTVPIFSGGYTSSRLREAHALVDQARHDLEEARRQLELGTRSAFLGVSSGAAQVTAREQVLQSSQSQLEATRLGREVGVRTSVDLLNAEQKFYESKRNLAQARYQYLQARLQLAAAVGQLTPEVLAEINALLTARPTVPVLASNQPKTDKPTVGRSATAKAK